MSEAVTAPTIEGRSLWADARRRLVRNRLAVASIAVLLLVGFASIFGPPLTGRPFDKVHPDHVRRPPQISAAIAPAELELALERVAKRIRAELVLEPPGAQAAASRGVARVRLASARAFDERNLAYFERTDIFAKASVASRAEDGKTLILEVPIRSQRFLFGTDSNGRDLLTRTLIAGRVSLSIGLAATAVALIIGVLYGAVAGYLGGRVDGIMMRVVDILYALPFMFFVILLVVFFGRNYILMFLAVGAIEWLDMARIVRGQTLSIRRQEYVEAAEALGVGTWGILRRHVIPNTLGPVIVTMTLLVPKVILLESFLSFLGLGVQEPMTSWGVLIAEGARNIEGAPYMALFPSLMLVATLFALNFLGDGLRDALDPKDR